LNPTGYREEGGFRGLSENGKPAKISIKPKNRKKFAQNRKTAQNNDQNPKFATFIPSTLDTTPKYWF